MLERPSNGTAQSTTGSSAPNAGRADHLASVTTSHQPGSRQAPVNYPIPPADVGDGSNDDPQVVSVRPRSSLDNGSGPADQDGPGDLNARLLAGDLDAEKGHVHAESHHGFQHGVYWRSPFMMVLTLSLGIVACFSHHVFYSKLRGLPADPVRQQIYVR
jgi:hypothetical protein